MSGIAIQAGMLRGGAGGSFTEYSESFESGAGQWTLNNFVRRTGSTPSGNTGPTGAQDGSYYVYFEASSQGVNYEEDISWENTQSNSPSNLNFFYHSYHANQIPNNSINVVHESGGSETVLYDTGNIGSGSSSWINVNISLSGIANSDSIILRFIKGTGDPNRPDICFDNITIS